MIAVDSSVVVAAFGPWHESYEAATKALSPAVRLPAHAALESYSVLTRLPPPHRAALPLVTEYLLGHFRERPLVLSPAGYRRLLDDAAGLRIGGGAI